MSSACHLCNSVSYFSVVLRPHSSGKSFWVTEHLTINAQEVIDLNEQDQRKLWEEVSHVCRAIRSSFEPGLKLNIAAIGNVVRTMP